MCFGESNVIGCEAEFLLNIKMFHLVINNHLSKDKVKKVTNALIRIKTLELQPFVLGKWKVFTKEEGKKAGYHFSVIQT